MVSAQHALDNVRYSRKHDNNIQSYSEYRVKWREAYNDFKNAKRDIQLANKTVMDSILKQVSTDDFWTVRLEFVKKAYPEVFNDKNDATSLIQSASGIDTLDTVQRSNLDEIATTYRFEYWELCEKMIQNRQDAITETDDNPELTKQEQGREASLNAIRYERSELNDLAKMRLRLILTDSQIENVPGLDKTAAILLQTRY